MYNRRTFFESNLHMINATYKFRYLNCVYNIEAYKMSEVKMAC